MLSQLLVVPLSLAQSATQSSLADKLLRDDVLPILGAFGLPLCIVIVVFWHKTRCREEELRTIAELARAGHTAEDIERLMKASSD